MGSSGPVWMRSRPPFQPVFRPRGIVRRRLRKAAQGMRPKFDHFRIFADDIDRLQEAFFLLGSCVHAAVLRCGLRTMRAAPRATTQTSIANQSFHSFQVPLLWTRSPGIAILPIPEKETTSCRFNFAIPKRRIRN